MFYACKVMAYGCAGVAGVCVALAYVQGGVLHTVNLLTFSILTGVFFRSADAAKVNADMKSVIDGILKGTET